MSRSQNDRGDSSRREDRPQRQPSGGQQEQNAAPRSDEEAREMERAEELGKRKAEGMQDPKDRMEDAPGKDAGSVKERPRGAPPGPADRRA